MKFPEYLKVKITFCDYIKEWKEANISVVYLKYLPESLPIKEVVNRIAEIKNNTFTILDFCNMPPKYHTQEIFQCTKEYQEKHICLQDFVKLPEHIQRNNFYILNLPNGLQSITFDDFQRLYNDWTNGQNHCHHNWVQKLSKKAQQHKTTPITDYDKLDKTFMDRA